MEGVAEFVGMFEDKETAERASEVWMRERAENQVETPLRRRARIRKERMEAHDREVAEKAAQYDRFAIEGRRSGDPYCTLFVSNLNYNTSRETLIRAFDYYGRVRDVFIIMDRVKHRPKGYAFIEFEKSQGMREAYKHANRIKIDNRRVCVDYERARTIEGWKPLRLGGGYSCARLTDEEKKAFAEKQEEKMKRQREEAAAAAAEEHEAKRRKHSHSSRH